MSLRQVESLAKAVEQKRRAELVELATCVRMAQADGKDWKNFIKEIERSG